MSFLRKLTTRKSVSNTDPAQMHQSAAQMEDTPPVYSTTATSSAQGDSPYAFLSTFDTCFLIDDSGSMSGRNWRETAAALSAIAPICTEQDANGIDLYFLNHRNPFASTSLGAYTNVISTASVLEIFRVVTPNGGTPTGARLNKIIQQYIEELVKKQKQGREASLKPLNIIVITDGVASDDVESVIVSAARKLDTIGAEPWQVGIQFFQVGQERDAAADLKELDDALSEIHGVRDMVDTVPWSGVDGAILTAKDIMKVTMGAVNRKLDRKRVIDSSSRGR